MSTGEDKKFLFDTKNKKLPNQIVYLKMIIRDGSLIEKTHSHAGLSPGCMRKYPLMVDNSGIRKNLFARETKEDSDAERAYLERVTGLDLNPYNRDNEYFKEHDVVIPYTIKNGDGKAFDLSKPHDYIDYRIMLATGLVADVNTPKHLLSNLRYQYYFTTKDFKNRTEANKAKAEFDASLVLGKIGDSVMELRAFYKIHTGRFISDAAKKDVVLEKVVEIKKQDPSAFVATFNNAEYSDLSFMAKAEIAGAITSKQGVYYQTGSNKPLALDGVEPSLKAALEYINHPTNQAVKAGIVKKIELI